VRGAADLGHPPGAQPGDSRPEDVARDRCQVVLIDHARAGHPVVLCQRHLSVQSSDPSRDVGNGDAVPPGAVRIPGEQKNGVALAGWSFTRPQLAAPAAWSVSLQPVLSSSLKRSFAASSGHARSALVSG
jgi:hypothetical protein